MGPAGYGVRIALCIFGSCEGPGRLRVAAHGLGFRFLWWARALTRRGSRFVQMLDPGYVLAADSTD